MKSEHIKHGIEIIKPTRTQQLLKKFKYHKKKQQL